MNTWYIGIKTEEYEINPKDRIQTGAIAEFVYKYFNGRQGGYEESTIRLSVFDDGHVFISEEHGGDGYISLNPFQLAFLKRHLNEANK